MNNTSSPTMNSTYDIVICEFMDEGAIKEHFADHNVLYDPKLVDKPDELLKSLGNARAIVVRNRTQVREELLTAAPHLQVVGRLGVGLDNIDMDACATRNITVCPATGANDIAVAEYVINAALNLLRPVWSSGQAMTAGQWPRPESIGCEASGKTLGLVGFGAIARETAVRAKILGMKIEAYDPYLSAENPAWDGVAKRELNELLSNSDIVSLHVPLTPETHHVINAKALSNMKSSAMLINAARGGIVDEPALIQALTQGHLAGAALDVFEHEPLSKENGQHFSNVPNLLLTPHIAGVTKESNVRVSHVTALNVLKHLS